MIYAYLEDNSGSDHRHYFLCTEQEAGGQWVVRTANGRLGTIEHEKTYTGGANGPPFAGEKHADNYGNAIVRSRVDKGYKLVCSHLDDELQPRPIGSIPTWFERFFVKNPNAGTVTMTLASSQEEQAALHALARKLKKTTNEEKRHGKKQEDARQPFYGWKKRVVE